MNIIQRVQAPTPPFFKKLRNISLLLATLGASIITAPVALPAFLVKIAGYIALAGAVGSTVSQAVTSPENPQNEPGHGTAIREQ